MDSANGTAKGLSELIRDIKGRSADYKKALEIHAAAPWDREVEVQRQNLRRVIMKVMFTYPDDPVISKLEVSLWIDTSHTLIDRYRKLVAEMQAKIAKAADTNRTREQGRGTRFKQGEVGVVALRKLLNRFRGFLGSEEKFWTQLATRFARTFRLSEAEPAIAALSLLATDPEDLVQTADVEASVFELEHAVEPASNAKKLLFLQKCLISLGDLARYREQYNEQGGRPYAGRESHDETRKPGKRGGKGVPHPKDYSKSLGFYQQAKLLLPNEGHPSNQLAILSLYDGDHFDAAVNYYRALCAQQPFPTSRDNLLRSLQKARETSRTLSASAGGADAMKLRILELHAYWHSDPHASEAVEISENILSIFATLIAERSLTSDTIVNVITMAVAAMWSIRVYSSSSEGVEYPQDHPRLAERVILVHIIGLIRTLVTISSGQIVEAVAASVRDENATGGLVRFISAPFRRMLPALRVSSQWLRSNIEYIQTQAAELPQGAGTHTAGDTLKGFWIAYATFASQVDQTFPIERLPKSIILLDEDLELRGFIPFQNSPSDVMAELSTIADSAKVHPNEEHLMRLRDIQRDAKSFASMKITSLVLRDGEYVVDTPSDTTVPKSAPLNRGPPRGHETISDVGELDDDSRTVSTEDPVGLAMSATLDEQDDDDDEEQVLYPRMPTGATKTLSLSTSSTNAFPPPLSSVGGSSIHLVPTSTTAEDLLSRVLERASPSHGAIRLRASSDISLPPFTGSPQMQMQSPSPSHFYPTSNQYAQSNLITSAHSVTSASPYEQIPGTFDRTVGGVGLQPESHYRSTSISGSTPPIQFRPPAATISQIQYPSGSPRMPNPLGAIGSLPSHTGVRDNRSQHHEHHQWYQNMAGPLLSHAQLFSGPHE